MLIVTSKLPWRRQPTAPVRISWGHPLANSLVAHMLPQDNILINLAEDAIGTAVNESSRSGITLSEFGNQIITNRSTNTGEINFNSSIPFRSLSQITLINDLSRNSGNGTAIAGWSFGETSSNRVGLYIGGTFNGLMLIIATAYGYFSYSDREISNFAAVFNGNLTGNSERCKIYENGILQSLTFFSSIPSALPSTFSNIKIAEPVLSTTTGTGLIGNSLIYTRALSAEEILELYINPYQMLVPTLSRRYFIPLGGPQTLDITSGNETGTGIALTVTQPRSIALTDGTETGAGYAVDITQPRSIAVTTGDDAGVGYVLGITQPWSIAVTDGSETGAGEALGLLQPRSVAVVEGEETGIGYALDISTGGSRSLTVEAGTGADIGYALNRLQPRSIGLTAGTETGVGYALDIPLPGPVIAISAGNELCFGYACNVIQHGRKYRYPRPTKAIHTRHYTSRL